MNNITKDKLMLAWEAIKPEFDKKFAAQIQLEIEKAETEDEIRVIYRTLRAKTQDTKTKRQIRTIALDIFERILQAIGISI